MNELDVKTRMDLGFQHEEAGEKRRSWSGLRAFKDFLFVLLNVESCFWLGTHIVCAKTQFHRKGMIRWEIGLILWWLWEKPI
jgi:hypothetical protein